MNFTFKIAIFRFFFLKCLLLVYLFSHGNHLKVDSIKEILVTYEGVDTIRVDLLNQIALESWQTDYEETKKYAEEALSLANRLNYKKGIADAHLVTGLGKWGDGDFHDAIASMLLALEKHEENEDSLAMANSKFYIGVAYVSQAVIDLALNYFREILPFYVRRGDSVMIGNVYHEMAEAKIMDHDYELAIKPIELALKIRSMLGHEHALAKSEGAKGVILSHSTRVEEAISWFKKALPVLEKYQDHKALTLLKKHMGFAYAELGDLNTANGYLLQAVAGAQQIKNIDLEEDIYRQLKSLEESRGNYEKALHYFELLVNMNSNKISERVSNKVHELKIKYDKQQADNEIKLLNQEKKVQNTYIWGLSILVLVIVVSAVVIIISYRNNRKKDKALHATNQALMEAEIANAKLTEKDLKLELEQKNLKLTSYTMNFIQKGTLFKELNELISELRTQSKDEQVDQKISEMQRIVNRHLSIDKDWKDFNMYFDSVHPKFVEGLKSRLPSITSSDLKLCTLLKLNLNSKQIADIMSISPDSVKTARHRLRNKLSLNRDQNLTDFMTGIG